MNTGFLKFDCDIEMQAGIFNTSNSNLWTKLQRVFAQEIRDEYAKMRQAKFTEENLMKYLYGEQISQIPQRNYNLDMQNKYLNFGNQFLHACHGNGYSHMKRWVRERLFFLDTLLDYTVSSADYITIRANKQGSVYLDIQTYVPMYARIKWRDEANNTGTQIKKINRGETVRFNYVMPTATDQEVLVYGGRYLKDVGDLTNLQPTTLLISKAPKLTRLICTNNPNLINTDLSNCTMLQEIDLHGCTMLGGGIGSTPTLNVQKCTNLRRINIYDTQLTAIYTNTSGGNIQEINYPFTVQTVQIHNQPNLKSIGIPVHFINNGNPSNRFATSLVSVDIANCTNLTSMVKNYYEVNGEPVPVPTFLGVSSAQSFKISNSLTHLEQIDLSYCANLRSLSISDFYNLTEINFDDICAWDAKYSNLSEISINNCPYVETITFNQNTIDGTNSLGVAFAYGMTLDLSNLLNLKHIRSNVGVKGLQKLIVPPTVRSLVFDYPEDTRYSQQLSDIHSIWSVDAMYAHQDDGYTGIDLRGMDTITDFSMGSLASIDKADNLNIKITNTFPYFNYFRNTDFFKPTGTVDISDYTGSLAYLFKGIDMEKLDIVCNKQLTQTDARYMFAYASCNNDETITSLFSKMQNITDLSYMFYNAYITKAPLLPLSTTDCRYMFYNCPTMTETPANWLQDYPLTPQSDYCYTGCVNIRMIDGQPDTLDSIPSAWGGFGRSNKSYSGYEIHAENTLEREIDTAIASGLTLMNVAPEYGTTPVMTNDQSSFAINEGIDSNILISEGEYETAVLKGYSLTNLAKEKGETQEFERLTEQFEMTDGLDLGVEVVDGEFVEAKFHGNTLHNIVVEDGKTSPIANVKQTFDIDNNIEEGVMVADGEYVSMTIKGNTLTNVVPAQGTTTEMTLNKSMNELPDLSPIITNNDEIAEGSVYGQTFKNLVGKYGQTDIVEIMGAVNVKDVVNEGIFTSDGKMEKAVVKGTSLVNLINGDFPYSSNFPIDYKGAFKTSTKYTILLDVTGAESDNVIGFVTNGGGGGWDSGNIWYNNGKNVYTITTSGNDTGVVFRIRGNRGTVVNSLVILEGDYYEQGMNGEIKPFAGIGSVVSPKIVTQNQNLYWTENKTIETRDSSITYTDGTVTFGENNFSGYTCVDLNGEHKIEGYDMDEMQNWYINNDKRLGLGAGEYVLACSRKWIADEQGNGDKVSVFVVYDDLRKGIGLYSTKGQSMDDQYFINFTVTDDIRGLFVMVWYGGSRKEATLGNITLMKKQDFESINKTPIPSYRTIITTPSDLVLHSGVSANGTVINDTLDLNTGTVTKYYDMWDFATWIKANRGQSGWAVNDSKTHLTRQWNMENTHPSGTVYGGQGGWSAIIGDKFNVVYGNGMNGDTFAKADFSIGWFNKYAYTAIKASIFSSEAVDMETGTILDRSLCDKQFIQYFEENPAIIGLPLQNPIIEQVDLSEQPKPCSYKDGYITTLSNQIAPTLSCTIPTTNHFTTSQINPNTRYTLTFDGTATSANVGGTTVENPTSPMIVTSGSEQNVEVYGEGIENITVLHGDVTDREYGYVNDIQSVSFNQITTENIKDECRGRTFKPINTDFTGTISEDNTIFVKGAAWAYKGDVNLGFFYQPRALVLIECDVEMLEENHMCSFTISGNANKSNGFVPLNSDTAFLAISNNSGIPNNLHYVCKTGHVCCVGYYNGSTSSNFSFSVHTGYGACVSAWTGDVTGYVACGNSGVTISNLRIVVLEENVNNVNNLRSGDGQTITWTGDMNMKYERAISTLEHPITLCSTPNGVCDTYDLVNQTFTKRIGHFRFDETFASSWRIHVREDGSTWFRRELATGKPHYQNLIDDYGFPKDLTKSNGIATIQIGSFLGDVHSGKTLTSPILIGESYFGNYYIGVAVPQTLSTDEEVNAWLKENPIDICYETSLVETEQVSISNVPHLYPNGYVHIGVDNIVPKLTMKGKSCNTFICDGLERDTVYTLRYDGEVTSGNIGGRQSTFASNSLVTTGTTNIIQLDGEPSNVMMFKGDVRDQTINYFTGSKEIKNYTLVTNGGCRFGKGGRR